MRALFGMVCGAALAVLAASPVIANSGTVAVVAPGEVQRGERAEFHVTARSIDGQPLAGELVEMWIDGAYHTARRTDGAGWTVLRTSPELPLGRHSISVRLASAGGLVTESLVLEVVPAVLSVNTVPPLQGVAFELDGARFETDAHGVARIEVPKPGPYRLRLMTVDESFQTYAVEFARWSDAVFEPERTVTVPSRRELVVAFDLSYPVRVQFTDTAGRAVSPERISSVTVRSSHGSINTFVPDEPQWLDGSRAVRRLRGLDESTVRYSVEEVIIDGSNVVNRGQQVYHVDGAEDWAIEVILHDATFSARDAVFGFSVGTGVRLEYPDGTALEYPFAKDNVARATGLARGDYQVQVIGASGFAPVAPLVMSRTHHMELIVLTHFDLAFGLLLATTLAVGLLLIGRPRLIRYVFSFLFPRRRFSPERGGRR